MTLAESEKDGIILIPCILNNWLTCSAKVVENDYNSHGIFHLSNPGGVSIIRNCQQRGFHPHEEPSDGTPVYEHCSHAGVSLKQKVVDAPEILTVIGKIPHLSKFLNSLYNCQYKSFFLAFAGLTEQIKLDRYLHLRFRFYMREVRTVVYSQLLESHKSVTIEAMAKAFGVTVEFIDPELSRFIAVGKLHCKIDKVAGVLETNRPDAKNALYQATIKHGDFLLNRIQELSRVIDL
ncbi:hypothetical protein GOBAR_DD33892 [Gossypium barbadense]|nr:hypothetical protein GOBAR_DD33892 [Gossypium barbadense]